VSEQCDEGTARDKNSVSLGSEIFDVSEMDKPKKSSPVLSLMTDEP